MKWLTLSGQVSRPSARLRARSMIRRPRKKNRAAVEVRPPGRRGPGPAILAGLLLLALTVGVWKCFYRSELFALEAIEVRDYHVYSPREVIEMSGLEPGRNIFPLDPAAAREGITRNNDFRDASVRKIFPNSIRISVMEREPRAHVRYGKLYTIDDQGVILGARKSGEGLQLPVIRGLRVVDNSRELYPPDKRDACLDLLRELEELKIGDLVRIEEISVASAELIELKTAGRLDITLGPGGYRGQLARLRTVLERLGTDLARARKIDLRYSKIPVRFED